MFIPDKIDETPMNSTEINIEKIGALFPGCITEGMGENGKVERMIDFDKLRQELSKIIVDGQQERYGLSWPEKRKAICIANTPAESTLRPNQADSIYFDEAKNIYIEGDNLEVLKCLRESYLGKVKVIYIDPPYNTGTDFIYRDNFSESKEGYLSRSGQTDKQGNFLISNLETNGRFHTDWLNMIYPRLKVARDFLSEDGVIFISIDDNELYSTKLICDELFGSSNFLGNLVIQTATDNNPTQVKVEHEYIICYAKNKVVQQPWSARSEKIEIIMKKYESLKRKYGSDVGAIRGYA